MSEIDVTKCRFYNTNNGFTGAYCTAHNNYCRHIRNCYYKQPARKEQECEELKEQFKLAEPLYQSCNIKDKKIKKLKQTLAEIKEIAKNMNKECFYDDFNCDDCDMINGCTYQGKLSVLQKISECERESNKEDN